MFRIHESNVPLAQKQYSTYMKALLQPFESKKKFAKTLCPGEPLGVVLWEINYIENL